MKIIKPREPTFIGKLSRLTIKRLDLFQLLVKSCGFFFGKKTWQILPELPR